MTEAIAAAPAAPVTPAAPAAPVAPVVAAPAVPAVPVEGAFTVPADVLDWGANKGYNKEAMTKLYTENPDVYKMATSYRETEKSLHAATGADKLVMPKDANDFTQVSPVLDRLGAPAKGADYKLEIPQGGDSTFALNAADKMAELKLLPAQALGLNKWWNDKVAGIQAETATKDANEGRDSVVKLETEWGADTQHNSKIAAQGFNKLAADIGMDANRMAEIRNSNKVTLSAYEFAKLTKAYGENAKVGGDNFEGNNDNTGGDPSLTPEGAKAEINRKLADPAYAKRYLAKDADVIKEMNQLYLVAGKGGVTSAKAV